MSDTGSRERRVCARARAHTFAELAGALAGVANGFATLGLHLHMKTGKSRGLLASYSRANEERG